VPRRAELIPLEAAQRRRRGARRASGGRATHPGHPTVARITAEPRSWQARRVRGSNCPALAGHVFTGPPVKLSSGIPRTTHSDPSTTKRPTPPAGMLLTCEESDQRRGQPARVNGLQLRCSRQRASARESLMTARAQGQPRSRRGQRERRSVRRAAEQRCAERAATAAPRSPARLIRSSATSGTARRAHFSHGASAAESTTT
jgi:hypothetical protein